MKHGIATAIAIALAAVWGAAASSASADDSPDVAFAQRMFAANAGKPTAYACFARHYDAAHLAQHPLQKVAVMKLLISSEKVTDDKYLNYSFRLGINFRNRPGDFDSSGDCGHAPTVRNPDTDAPIATGIDFQCDVDCDGGGLTVNLANKDAAAIVKLPDHVRIWKGKDFDEGAATDLMAGTDDKIFRLDRADANECARLATDRKELAAMRHK
jgi:hypothetical protein